MRTLVRRLVPGLVLPLLLVGLSPSQAAEPGTPTTPATAEVVAAEAPTPAEVSGALGEAPATLVPDTAPVSQVSSQAVVSGAVSVPRDPAQPVQLGPVKGGLTIGLPATDADTSVVRDGVSIFQDDAAATSYAVNPLAGGGAQFLVAIGGPESPEEHAFPVDVPAGAQLDAHRGRRRTGDRRRRVDAREHPGSVGQGRRRPRDPDALHDRRRRARAGRRARRCSGAAYPVLADPSIFSCDAWTATCVKFTRAETVRSSNFAGAGMVGARRLRRRAVQQDSRTESIAVGCTAYVGIYAYLLERSFSSAGGKRRVR